MSWRSFACSATELNLDVVLACGQSFRWRQVVPGEWRSVLAGRVWTLRQTDGQIHYSVQEPGITEDNNHETKRKTKTTSNKNNSVDNRQLYESILRDYFQLHVNLESLYTQWCRVDPNFKSVAAIFPGVRILRQDPVENLFSFICSSNNHISRISGMVERLCTHYGEEVGTAGCYVYHSFPTVEALSRDGVEGELREMGFGYRAKFIHQSACMIHTELGADWLTSLRQHAYADAKRELMRLPGVGAKVADCVCLSLDKASVIPVDTHVWQIAVRDYMPRLTHSKSLTDKLYQQIGDFFRELWGDYAGWAHSVLFSADLKKFQDVKSPKSVKSPELETASTEKTLTAKKQRKRPAANIASTAPRRKTKCK